MDPPVNTALIGVQLQDPVDVTLRIDYHRHSIDRRARGS
jgi:hypothetical protein